MQTGDVVLSSLARGTFTEDGFPGDGSLRGASQLLKRETFQREQRVSASKVLLSENAMKAPFHPLCYTNPQVLRLQLEGVVGGLHLPKIDLCSKESGAMKKYSTNALTSRVSSECTRAAARCRRRMFPAAAEGESNYMEKKNR